MNKLRLTSVPVNERKNYLDMLLMADESEEVVKGYINKGDLFAIFVEENLAGVILFTPVSEETVELKNFALIPEFRGKGFGKAVIEESLFMFSGGDVKRVIVGTANSSIDNIAFYQKAGFRICDIKRDFFAEYPEPIYENGIRAIDMIMFEKELD